LTRLVNRFPSLKQRQRSADCVCVTLARGIAARIAGAAVVGMLACGCGGTSAPAKASSSQALAMALANAINLRASDVPGFVGRFQRDRPAPNGPLGGACGATVRGLVGFDSQRFGRGGTVLLPTEGVSSSVYVMESEAAAARELALLGSARTRACVKNATTIEVFPLASLLKPLRVVGTRRIRELAFTPRGVPGRSRVYLDEAGFVVGRALVDLLALGSPHVFPLATERRLFSLLYNRATAQKP
jgi:hypothetical protein